MKYHLVLFVSRQSESGLHSWSHWLNWLSHCNTKPYICILPACNCLSLAVGSCKLPLLYSAWRVEYMLPCSSLSGVTSLSFYCCTILCAVVYCLLLQYMLPGSLMMITMHVSTAQYPIYIASSLHNMWHNSVQMLHHKKAGYTIIAVSYTHLTLPTKRIV